MTTFAGEFAAENLLAELGGGLNLQHARIVRVVAQAQRAGGWFGEGIHSVAHWLTIHLGVSPGHAKQIDTIARRVDDFPRLMEAFDKGELAIDQVYEVAAKAPAWADRQVTEFAKVATVRQLRRMIRDEHFEHDPDEPPADPAPPRNAVSFTWDEHSRLRLSGSLDAEQGAIFEGAINEARDALFRAGDGDVTWADALAELARRSLACAPDDRRHRFVPRVHLHVDTGAAQLTNGTPLPPAVRDYLLCDSAMRPVWERDCVPFGLGRTQRAVPDRLRRIVEHRDRGCRVPGCGAVHGEIHHILHWSDGGPTETWNLIQICGRHHKRHHEGLLGITGNADHPETLRFTDQHGRLLASHPNPTPPHGPPPRPPAPYEHPTGERLQGKWTGLGWIHPNLLAKRRSRSTASP